MPQYMLTVHGVEGEPEPAEDAVAEMYRAVDEFNGKVRAAGAWVFAGGLAPRESATVVRRQAGEVLITDGPFAESKEFVGGFWVIEAADLDVALEWAGQATTACQAPVEVRPFQGVE